MQSLYGAIALLYKLYHMENNKSRGLGDSIEKFTKATGIKSLVQMGNRAVKKTGCGCDKRRETLNKRFPYKK